MTFKIFRRGVMTFRNSREHCGRLDSACSAKRELVFKFVSEILRARVDGSDMASFDGVVLGSFVTQVRGIRFSDFGVSGACQGEWDHVKLMAPRTTRKITRRSAFM